MSWFKASNTKFGYHYGIDDGSPLEPPLWISYDLQADPPESRADAISTPTGYLSDLPGSLTVVHAKPTDEWLKGRLGRLDKETYAEFLEWASETVLSESDNRFEHAIGVGCYYQERESDGFSPACPERYYFSVACEDRQVRQLIEAAALGISPHVCVDLGGPAFGSSIGPEKWEHDQSPYLLIWDIQFVFQTTDGSPVPLSTQSRGTS